MASLVLFGPGVETVQRWHIDDFPLVGGVISMTINDINPKNPQVDIQPPQARPGPNSSPFDLKANGMARQLGEGVRVDVIITDTSAEFQMDGYALTAGHPDSVPLLRWDVVQSDSSNRRWKMSFYIRRAPTSSAEKDLSFNLGVVIKGNSWKLPIHVDPKIENVGG